jgi:hypothetical protein
VRTCEYDGDPFTAPRSHPWTTAAANADFRYIDLKAEPSRIRTSLEDFTAWAHHSAVEEFYTLLEWLNGPISDLESNDCAFTGPHATDTHDVSKALECSGRIMVLYRDLAQNLSRARVESLKDTLHRRLAVSDTKFRWGVVGTSILPARYVTLELSDEDQLGHQLMISFWAWGDFEVELMKNLGRVVRNLSRALETEPTR